MLHCLPNVISPVREERRDVDLSWDEIGPEVTEAKGYLVTKPLVPARQLQESNWKIVLVVETLVGDREAWLNEEDSGHYSSISAAAAPRGRERIPVSSGGGQTAPSGP